MHSADVTWLAGLLEGEGSFMLQGGKYPRISVNMTDMDVLQRVSVVMEAPLYGPYTPTPQRPTQILKPVWLVVSYGEEAVQWMMRLYPLMGIRRRLAIRKCLGVWGSRLPKEEQKHAA